MSDPAPRPPLLPALFRRNPALVQMLGLSPLLAIAVHATAGLALAAISSLTLLVCALPAARLGALLPPGHRHLASLMLAAAMVSLVDLALALQFPALREALTIYMPLVAGNCVIVHTLAASAAAPRAGTATASAPRAAASPAAVAAGFSVLAMALGAARELVGRGTLFADLALLGIDAPGLTLLPPGTGWRLALMPPGALLAMAAAFALHRAAGGGMAGETPDGEHAPDAPGDGVPKGDAGPGGPTAGAKPAGRTAAAAGSVRAPIPPDVHR